MPGYTKLFNSILASTIWREPDPVRIVWITMLAMADRYGNVEASVPGLADLARVTVEAARNAVSALEAPDPDSRSKALKGRRIVPLQGGGGWRLVNFTKYREKMNSDERRQYLAAKQRERRERLKNSQHQVNKCIQPSTVLSQAAPSPTPTPSEKSTVPRRARKVFDGERVVIFEWLHDDCNKTLGAYADDFGLLEWYAELDGQAVRNGLVIPKRDGGQWVQAQLVAECQRRGLQLRFPPVKSAANGNGWTGPQGQVCKHVPRCESAAACTLKYLNEQRRARGVEELPAV